MNQSESLKSGDLPEDVLSDFPLDEAVAKAVADIVGAEHVGCVGEAIQIYRCKRNFYRGRLPIPQLNKKLEKARGKIADLAELLGESTIRDYLSKIANEHFPEAGGKQLIAGPAPYFGIAPQLHVFDMLEKLDKVCESAIKKQKPGKGRPKGATSGEAIHDLLFRLYQCCESANGGPLTTKSGNMLEELVKVLNKPLGLGGNLSGIVITTIKRDTRKGGKPEKKK